MTCEGVLAATAIVVFAAGGTRLAVTDLRTRRLRDRGVALTGVGVLVPLTVAAAVAGAWSDWATGLLAAAVLAAGYFLLAIATAGGVGMGDVKFAAVVGLACGWHGWDTVLVGLAATFLLAAVVGAGLLWARRVTRTSHLPFGPFMVAGALLSMAMT